MPCSSSVFSCLSGIPRVPHAIFFSNSDAARVSQTIFFSKTHGWTISNMKASQNKQPAGLSTRFYVSDPRAIVNYYLYSGCSVFLFPTYTI